MDNNEKRRRKRIYVSGPMCVVEEYQGRFWAFADAIDRCGMYAVVNPAGFAVIDLKVLEKCDAIFMMPGWRRSVGARMEYEKAKELEITIHGFDLIEEEN